MEPALKNCNSCQTKKEPSQFRIVKSDYLYHRCRSCERRYERIRPKRTRAKKCATVHIDRKARKEIALRLARLRFRNAASADPSLLSTLHALPRDFAKHLPIKRLKTSLRTGIWYELRKKRSSRPSKITPILGCTSRELKAHLEAHFKSGMSWENYGYGDDKWNIDHIVPLASATSIEEIYALSHFSNLQPLWQTENFSKGDSMPGSR